MNRLIVLGWMAFATCASAIPAPGSAETRPLDYVIVVTGGELLEGVISDAHTPFLVRTLRPLGCRCVGSMIVDDQREAIQRAVRSATNQAPLVIVTGGLGPTPNDITRETLSEFTGIRLHEHPDAVADLERRLGQRKDLIRTNLVRQTRVPTQGGYLKNPAGTAVGLIFDAGGPVIVALPGPPRELQPMVHSELVPYLRRRFGVRDFGSSLTLRFVGAGQSLIDQTLKDHVSVAPDVTITSLFEASRVDFTFSLPGRSPEDQARLRRLAEDLREHLAEYIYADDGSSLEEVVVHKLQATGTPLVLAEISSGGNLAAALSGVPGIERILTGAYEAPTAKAMSQLLQLPPQPVPESGRDRTRQFADAAARLASSQWAIAVGAPESDEKGGKYTWVVLKTPENRWDTQRFSIREGGDATHAALITQILDWLRRRVK